jgi:hypothetical protein
LIQNCKSYAYLRETPELFTKEERETLLDPYIEDLSEENFQRLYNIYKKLNTQLLNKQINENMKLMSSSTIENQEDILMKEAYDHIYLKEEKKRIKKELFEKENLERERINKIKQRWDEVFILDHKFYFNKRSWEIFRKQKPIILHKFKWIRVNESSKWKNLYKQEGIIIKNSCWKNLFEEKQVGTIHFINKEICNRSNTEYYRRLIEYNFIDNDLDFDFNSWKEILK